MRVSKLIASRAISSRIGEPINLNILNNSIQFRMSEKRSRSRSPETNGLQQNHANVKQAFLDDLAMVRGDGAALATEHDITSSIEEVQNGFEKQETLILLKQQVTVLEWLVDNSSASTPVQRWVGSNRGMRTAIRYIDAKARRGASTQSTQSTWDLYKTISFATGVMCTSVAGVAALSDEPLTEQEKAHFHATVRELGL